jgi:hypothetical protein
MNRMSSSSNISTTPWGRKRLRQQNLQAKLQQKQAIAPSSRGTGEECNRSSSSGGGGGGVGDMEAELEALVPKFLSGAIKGTPHTTTHQKTSIQLKIPADTSRHQHIAHRFCVAVAATWSSASRLLGMAQADEEDEVMEERVFHRALHNSLAQDSFSTSLGL